MYMYHYVICHVIISMCVIHVGFVLLQYFIRMKDSDVELFLKLFTFIHENDIARIVREHRVCESAHCASLVCTCTCT